MLANLLGNSKYTYMLYNCPLEGIGVKDIIIIVSDFRSECVYFDRHIGICRENSGN